MTMKLNTCISFTQLKNWRLQQCCGYIVEMDKLLSASHIYNNLQQLCQWPEDRHNELLRQLLKFLVIQDSPCRLSRVRKHWSKYRNIRRIFGNYFLPFLLPIFSRSIFRVTGPLVDQNVSRGGWRGLGEGWGAISSLRPPEMR